MVKKLINPSLLQHKHGRIFYSVIAVMYGTYYRRARYESDGRRYTGFRSYVAKSRTTRTSNQKHFSKGDVRGKVGENPIIPDFVLKLSWLPVRYKILASRGSRKIIFGKDTYISGYMLELAYPGKVY